MIPKSLYFAAWPFLIGFGTRQLLSIFGWFQGRVDSRDPQMPEILLVLHTHRRFGFVVYRVSSQENLNDVRFLSISEAI